MFLFFQKGSNLCSVRVTDGRTEGDKDKLIYWIITSSLDHSTLCYLQDSTSRCFSTELLTRMLCGSPLLQAFSGTASWHWLKLPPADPVDADPYRICIHRFITPTTSDQPRDWFCLFTMVLPVQEKLWLKACSSVNM